MHFLVLPELQNVGLGSAIVHKVLWLMKSCSIHSAACSSVVMQTTVLQFPFRRAHLYI
uniref:Uncharacterized protein n=1 Tax=Manihot esculenta TaxID=3983 RepID=A0A2C9UMA4_MANES